MKASALSQLARRTEEPAISWLMKLTLDHPKIVSLAAGFTDNASLPLTETAEVLHDLLQSRAGRPALQYGTTAGDPLLRKLTAARVQSADSHRDARIHDPARTLITGGSQQLLYMTTEALCDPGDIVLIEDPTYFVFLGITQSHGLRTRGVRMEQDGIDLAHLEKILTGLKRSGELKHLKMLYIVSYFQNPTGRTTSFAKKRAALELLKTFERGAGHPIYLLEDAAYRELRFTGNDEPSALATAFPDRVLYAGTYSKPFASGARVGFGILPAEVFQAVVRIKGNHDFGTSNLLQQLLAHALDSGAYEKHLPVLRARYAAKSAKMTNAIREHFPSEVQWAEPAGGLYVWAQAPRRNRTGIKSKIFQAALNCGVLYVPGELCYGDDPARRKPNHGMRLSFGGARDADIPLGIMRLGRVLRTG